jgi:hypothetical protein
MKQVLLKALNIIKAHIIHILQNSSNTIDPNKVGKFSWKQSFIISGVFFFPLNKNHTLLSDDAYTLFYGRFRINAPKVKVLAEELEQRCARNPEWVRRLKILLISCLIRYEKTLSDCHECYTNQRRILLTSRWEKKQQEFFNFNVNV